MQPGSLSRRTLLGRLAQGSAAALFPQALARAATTPANNRTGTLADVEHVVILMQENRSFDHYFGTLNGVRGFADPRAAPQPDGTSIFRQRGAGGVVAPFRFDVAATNFPVMHSLHHDWETTHQAWNQGRCDQWIAAKSPLTMGYVTRDDIPYHYALADAFTVCDAYHASLLGPTCPNRLFFLTGSVDPAGRGGGPVVDNSNITQAPGGHVYGPGWTTYAERLQRAGVDWRAYRQGEDPASDDDSDGGMNLLLAFDAFRQAVPGQPLYERGVRPRRLEALKDDVLANRLPQVSWIFPPRIFCEHPTWPPEFGVEYIARILDALTCNPEVWSRTVFLLVYDENDGFFDHVPPPAPPLDRTQGESTVATLGEVHSDGRPFGLGARVPLLAISPWSRGGFVNSQVFDHTSIIRFLEARFGVHEPNISPWRRAVCGDLTSLFDFANPNGARVRDLSVLDAFAPLPDQKDFETYRSRFDNKPAPSAPGAAEAPPVELGPRPARPLPYDLAVDARVTADGVALTFRNLGAAGAAFQAQDLLRPDLAPRRYTVEAGRSLQGRWGLAEGGRYDLRVSGPNGFLRAFSGGAGAGPTLSARHQPDGTAMDIAISNPGEARLVIAVEDGYGGARRDIILEARATRTERVAAAASGGWYDLTLTAPQRSWRLCGHVETGRASISDPAIERRARALRAGDTDLA